MSEQDDDVFWIAEAEKERLLENEYKLGDIVGRGASSIVYRCLHKGRTEWACKVFRKSGLNRRAAQTEIGVLVKLRHPNIIGLREVFETSTEIQLVLELVTGGEMFERIVERGHYSEQDAACALRQILDALQYLHANGVVHRDIKPENLLYETEDDDSKIKLADFGLSKMVVTHNNPGMTTLCGTVGYCAPEVLLQKNYDSSVDLWSLGVVAYIMLCGFEPFWDEAGELAVCRRVVEGTFEYSSPWWDDISDSAKDLITQLLQVDPTKRPTATEAAKHPWIRGLTPLDFHMTRTIKKLREFNARRKFRAATHAVLATKRALFLVSPAARKGLKGESSDIAEAASSKST
ncbi:calcium/calmodulin-dependent protein kinase type IV-like [Neocloeon triangulifer]|uniref:calcium/calmodulin-dependent protein kinase type IV-like n=1 Tax=Neocloeon triangulifer TaxID=2078957 RepID=UPI00286EC0FC|nr:calcium/calmodulin-dependent protein kinase type IV-like [Neocloeon triangulifer]